MNDGRPIRLQVERRVRPERRSGLDRRIAERRRRQTVVLVERRVFADRRSQVERRSTGQRRKLRDRRGFERSFDDITPS